MKKTLLQICSVVGLVILAAVVSAQAQTQYRANVPFDFQVGQKNYRAGEYFVGLLGQDSQSKIIVIRDATGRNSYAIAPTISDSKPETAILVFNRYADRYFLAEINAPSFNAELSKSKSEAKLAGGDKPQKETVAMTKKK